MLSPEQLYHDLESLLELPSNSLTGSESLEEVRWDSMAVVMFIAMADEKYSIAVSPSKLADVSTVVDIYNLMVSRS